VFARKAVVSDRSSATAGSTLKFLELLDQTARQESGPHDRSGLAIDTFVGLGFLVTLQNHSRKRFSPADPGAGAGFVLDRAKVLH
jgi:hypothetical protein